MTARYNELMKKHRDLAHEKTRSTEELEKVKGKMNTLKVIFFFLRCFHDSSMILDNPLLNFYLRCESLASARYLYVNC